MNGDLRKELVSWEEVDRLIDTLIPQIRSVGTFDAMLMVTRGGLIPGGLLSESLNIRHVLTAAVDFPATETAGLMAWPRFLQFPGNNLLEGRRTLIVDDVWGSGRTSATVRGRAESAGANPWTCVLHYNPQRSLFSTAEPDFYGAITDAWVVYPWELDRGLRGIGMAEPEI